jgi:NitT/TauT family transport system ATP-binding protein
MAGSRAQAWDDNVSAFVEIDNVTHVYGGDSGVVAVEKLSLTIAEGEFAAVVGPSGCGKSTLMKLVTACNRHVPAASALTACGSRGR